MRALLIIFLFLPSLSFAKKDKKENEQLIRTHIAFDNQVTHKDGSVTFRNIFLKVMDHQYRIYNERSDDNPNYDRLCTLLGFDKTVGTFSSLAIPDHLIVSLSEKYQPVHPRIFKGIFKTSDTYKKNIKTVRALIKEKKLEEAADLYTSNYQTEMKRMDHPDQNYDTHERSYFVNVTCAFRPLKCD